MSEVSTGPGEAGVRPRPGGGQYPDYRLGEPESGSFYGRYESGRGVDYYEADPNLRPVLEGHLDGETLGWAEERLGALGERAGHEISHRADATDEANHQLVRYDRFGRDISEVRCHPNWKSNLNEVFDFGLVGWNHDEGLLGRYGRAPVPLLTAFDYLVGQAEASLCCPLELAHGTVAVLEKFAGPDLRERFLGPVVSTEAADRMQVAQVATEVTGGSDVGSTRTVARRDGERWLLSGEKWFASNVDADLIVTLARPEGGAEGTRGLAMFVVPRRREDGEPNGISIRRLKDKIGTIGVPTGELILSEAEGFLVGDPQEGFRYMAEMLNHTRYWNAVGSLGIMRRSYLEAAVYAARRRSFGTSSEHLPARAPHRALVDPDTDRLHKHHDRHRAGRQLRGARGRRGHGGRPRRPGRGPRAARGRRALPADRAAEPALPALLPRGLPGGSGVGSPERGGRVGGAREGLPIGRGSDR